MNLARKKQIEENQLEKSEPKRLAKAVPLIKKQIILQHKLKKSQLKSDAEKFAYEAGRAAAELFTVASSKGDCDGEDEYKAEDILSSIYESIEDGSVDLLNANRIVAELKKPLQQRNNQLRIKIAAKTKRSKNATPAK